MDILDFYELPIILIFDKLLVIVDTEMLVDCQNNTMILKMGYAQANSERLFLPISPLTPALVTAPNQSAAAIDTY